MESGAGGANRNIQHKNEPGPSWERHRVSAERPGPEPAVQMAELGRVQMCQSTCHPSALVARNTLPRSRTQNSEMKKMSSCWLELVALHLWEGSPKLCLLQQSMLPAATLHRPASCTPRASQTCLAHCTPQACLVQTTRSTGLPCSHCIHRSASFTPRASLLTKELGLSQFKRASLDVGDW